MVKKVTAPKTYDPGRGRPKEHLAYLNEREMAYLRSINGNNMERGPRGLPSFPPDDSLGSNSGNSRPTGGGSKGPGGPSGPNSGPSGGLGGGGKGAGSSGTQSRGPGGPSGPNSGPSQSAGSKAAPSAPSRTPSSPMGGQGPSFSSTKAASSYNKDRTVQQKVQINDARNAVKNTPAARNDLALGGIRSLNVGPMGTPVKVGQAAKGPIYTKTVSSPISVTSQYGTGYYNKFSPSLPGMKDPQKFSREITRETLVNEAGVPMGVWSNTFDPNKLTPGAQDLYRSIMDNAYRTNTPVDFFSGKTGRVGTKQHPAGQAIDIRIKDPITGRNVGEAELARKYGPAMAGKLASNPIGSEVPRYGRTASVAADVQAALGPKYRDFARGVIGGFMENPDVYGEFQNQRWGGAFQTGETAKDYMHFDEGKVASAVSGDQARLRKEAANLVSDRPTRYALGSGPSTQIAMTSASVPSVPSRTVSASMDPTAAVTSAFSTAKDLYNSLPSMKDLSERYAGLQKDLDAYRQAKTGPLSAVTGPIADARLKEAVTGYASQGIQALKDFISPSSAMAATPSGPIMSGEKAAAKTIAQAEGEKILDVENVPESDEVYGPKNVSPEVQELMADIDRKNKYGVRGIKSFPVVGNVVRAGDALRGVFTGKNTTEADADLKRAYMQGNATQRAELERGYPNLTKFAQQAGLEPQLPMSNYENWRQRSFGTGGGGTSTTVAGAGGTPDIGSGGKVEYRPIPRQVADAGQADAAEKKESGRPQAYYNWDAGVGIPSPGDPDYTLYLKYLEEKAAARAAVS